MLPRPGGGVGGIGGGVGALGGGVGADGGGVKKIVCSVRETLRSKFRLSGAGILSSKEGKVSSENMAGGAMATTDLLSEGPAILA